MREVPGICDRCGQRYPLKELRFEYLKRANTNRRVCPDCYDESHPLLETENLRTNDKQYVPDSRPDNDDSRGLSAYNPVGGGNASTYLKAVVGTVNV